MPFYVFVSSHRFELKRSTALPKGLVVPDKHDGGCLGWAGDRLSCALDGLAGYARHVARAGSFVRVVRDVMGPCAVGSRCVREVFLCRGL